MQQQLVTLCNKRSLRNWFVTLCNKIIILIYLSAFLSTSIISLFPQGFYFYFHILDRVVIYGRGPPPTKSRDPLIRVLGDHITNEKGYISTFMIPMAIKLDRWKDVIHKAQNPLITWTHQVTWQIKTLYFKFRETMPTKLEMMIAYETSSLPTMVT